MKRNYRRLFQVAALMTVSAAAVVIPASAQSLKIEKLWEIPPTTRPYLPAVNNTERGLAFNPANGHLYIPSRSSGVKVFILEGETGNEAPNPGNSDLPELVTSGITGGTFALNLMGAGEDGAIYAANLSTSTASPVFKIYRWESEEAAPVVVFSGNPREGTGFRWGDAMDVVGSGMSTRLVISAGGTGATASKAVAVFSFTDESFTSMQPVSFEPAGVNAADLRLGITFGPESSLIGKTSGTATTRYFSYDLGVPSGQLIANLALESGISVIKYHPLHKLLFGLNPAAGNHRFVVYDATEIRTPTLLTSLTFPAGGSNNINLTGGIAIHSNRVWALNTHNGILACSLTIDTNPTPPTITAQPVGITILEGGSGVLQGAATGTKPLEFQWFLNGNPVKDATNAILRLSRVGNSDAGSYQLVARNAGGEGASRAAQVAVLPSVRSAAMEPVWKLAPGDRPYLTTDNTQRGLAYNPSSGNLLLISRVPTTAIHVLDAATGETKHSLKVDSSIVTGGTFPLNLLGVADDGVVYAANLTTDGASGSQRFKVYRWASDSADVDPEVVYNGDPNNGGGSQRWGDSFDVRGSGLDTQIAVGTRSGSIFAVLSTADGVTFSSTPFATTAPAGGFGLSAVFGEGNTLWGKQAGTGAVLASFDIGAGVAEVVQVFPTSLIASSIGAIAIDPRNRLLAGVSVEASDNLRLYSLPAGTSGPIWRDTEFFAADNDNLNVTGAADFADGWLFALDTNNGLMAMKVAGQLFGAREGGDLVLTWTGSAALQSTASLESPVVWTDVAGATSPYRVSTGSALYFRLRSN